MIKVLADVQSDVDTDIFLGKKIVHNAPNIVRDAQEVTIVLIVCLDILDPPANILARLTVRIKFVIRMMVIAEIIV